VNPLARSLSTICWVVAGAPYDLRGLAGVGLGGGGGSLCSATSSWYLESFIWSSLGRAGGTTKSNHLPDQ